MSGKTALYVLPATVLLLLPVSAPTAPAAASHINSPKGIVDCLLPGPLRRIGGSIYQMPQYPERVTASECTIRGGDFLLYDRANYETTLKHWITQAEQGSGDADAMLYVGEIYEQGIGRDADYATAASWYQKAADAGNTTAMISLAHLYKTGQGVELDLETAQGLYSQAFGSDVPVPLDPTSVIGADQRLETLVSEVDEVRRQKVAVELELQAANEQLTNARRALDNALLGDGESSRLINELRNSIAQQESDFAASQSNIAAMQAENDELKNLRQQVEEQEIETARLKALLAGAQTAFESSRDQLVEQKEALDAKQAEFDTVLAGATEHGEALVARSNELAALRKKTSSLETALRKAEDQRNLYQALASDATTQEERVATLTTRINVLEQQSGSAQGEFESLRNELAATQEQIDLQIASASQAAQLSESEITARDDEIQRLRAAVGRAEQETNRHGIDIDRLSQQSAELELLRADLEREQAQSNRLQQLLTDSQDRFAATTSRLDKVSAISVALEEEIAALRSSAAAGDQASQSILRQRESELRDSRDEIDTLQARIAETEDEFKQYQQQMSDTAVRQSKAIKDLRVAVAASRAEREQLEGRLASANQQLLNAQGDLDLERHRYTALQDKLREARAQGEAGNEALEERQNQLDSQTQQVAMLQQEIDRLNQQSNRYAAQINDWKTRVQAQKVEFVGPKIILSEPSEGLLAGSSRQMRGGKSRGIGVVAAASARETRSIRGYVEAPAGLASLAVNGMMVPFDDKHAFAQTIELQGDVTTIRIVARDSSGKEDAKEFEYRLGGSTESAVVYNKGDRLRESLLGDLRYYALLIANEDYENEDFASDLKTPVGDVKAIGKVLEENYGFEVEYVINADYDQMADALERVIYREQKDNDPDNDKDAILIYYAGHGFADRILGDNLRYFWMPVSASKSSPRTWYETVEISKYLKASSIPQIMVIADSCYAGNLPSRDGMHDLSEPEHSPDFRRYVKKRTKMKSRFVFTSGGNEPVLDDGGDGHSVFAREFLNVLQENTGLLRAYELQGQVAPRVERASAMVGKEQTPYFGYLGTAGHEFGEFFLPAPTNEVLRTAMLKPIEPLIDQSLTIAQTKTR